MGTPKYATITDYSKLYEKGYFAHDADASSFDPDRLPDALIGLCETLGLDGIVDVGAGNGILGKLTRARGLGCIDIDVTSRSDPDFIRFDAASHDPSTLRNIRSRCDQKFPGGYLVTSFDMAEHVDPEHLPDFIYNLAELINAEGVVSISTRPSSRANLYHSSVLPIDTWKYVFSLVGLEAKVLQPLQLLRSDQQFRSDTKDLLAVSVWQKRNLFGDDPSHQHYLHLTRTLTSIPSRAEVTERISSVLDTKYRFSKRTMVDPLALPRLFYLVSFVQDWSFLRSLLDVWPSSQVRVIIRTDFLAPAYNDMIEAYLVRVGVPCRRSASVVAALTALDDWEGRPGDLFVNATEGLPFLLHSMAALVTLAARKRGMTTVTFQHGFMIPDRTAHAAQFFIAMDEEAKEDFKRAAGSAGCSAVALGSPKQLDAAFTPVDPDAVAFRIRSVARHYRIRLLIGMNLHWSVHEETGECMNWLARAACTNPDVLFLLRPHPDDASAFTADAIHAQSNILIVDELALVSIDWPLSRLLAAVDGVISTHSTLICDALAARRPTALLPTGVRDTALRSVQRGWKKKGVVELSSAGLERGELPSGWPTGRETCSPRDQQGYLSFISGLVGLVGQADDPAAICAAELEVERTFIESCKQLSLDSHPHSHRQRVAEALNHYARSA